MGLTIRVTAATLIPRPETELLVEEVLRLAEEGMDKPREAGAKEGGPVIIDLCTGSGCIAVALAKKLPGSLVYATDISEKALEVAAYNAGANGVKDRIVFGRGDLYEAVVGFGLKKSAAFIVSNPPYVTDGDFFSLLPEIREHEPQGALRAGADGLDFIRKIVAGAPEYLAPGGSLVMEIGYGQAREVEALAKSAGAFSNISFKKDLAGIERMLIAGLPLSPSPPSPNAKNAP
jgi:release factor glutamine methyltransferase